MRELKSKKEVKRNFLNIFLLLFHKYKKTIHKLLLISLTRFTLIKKFLLIYLNLFEKNLKLFQTN